KTPGAQPKIAPEQRKGAHENPWSATLVRITDKFPQFGTPVPKVTNEVKHLAQQGVPPAATTPELPRDLQSS
ncbi:hypothetical protein, partial [Mycobacterium sp. SMC-17]|uniref:hypothetical protein n=1 Tax=Mycobacterium sp. SMC-17 TaxID=3381628 RepID=UPI003876F7C2